MTYTKGGNMERVYHMVADSIPRDKMPALSGLTGEKVRKALQNLSHLRKIKRIDGTGGHLESGRGRKGAEFMVIEPLEEKPPAMPEKIITSVWDLAKM